jgi:predicted RNA binding protein YcfA (HicA-like mRNA interferase family)
MKCSELLRLLRQAGWYADRQAGSHIIMKHNERTDFLIIPNHGSKEIGKGLEKKIKKQAGL